MLRTFAFGLFVVLLGVVGAAAQQAPAIPTAKEVADLLQKEPIAEATWPAWRKRLTDWFDDRTRQTDAAYRAVSEYFRGQADADGKLSGPYANDHLAWYFLGVGYQFPPPGQPFQDDKARQAYREALRLEPAFARGHRNLAWVLIDQAEQRRGKGPAADTLDLGEAERALKEALQLDPTLPIAGLDGRLLEARGRFDEAEAVFEKALAARPDDRAAAALLAQNILKNPRYRDRTAPRVEKITARFPDDPLLATFHALALGADNRLRESYRQLQHARSLGAEPEQILGPNIVRAIEENGRPGKIELFLWVMLAFAVGYAAVMLLMAVAGVLLARRTRGQAALDLLERQSADSFVAEGQVARAQGETLLARLYGLALMAGLILFYVAIPFVIAGLLAGTGLLLWLIFMAGRIPLKLVAIIAVVGGGSAWAVLKSVFTRPASGSFGLPKAAAQCPRLYETLAEVARRVDTDPVDEVYIAPGSAIGVHQEGRGPFGIFGVKRRVLTLGLSTLRFLTVGELKAILAHEYAHFSHRDTFYSRFIYQVHLSIENALNGMGATGGVLNYVNPFYWFLFLYYKSYSLLAAGYSRSREFLADRMACSLYGPDTFTSALTKVCTDGTLFEMTIYDQMQQLLREQRTFVNMYESFQQYRNEALPQQEREELYQKVLNEEASLFASHPTFKERVEAVAALPKAADPDPAPALTLFEKPEVLEEELTKFLTDYLAYIQYLQDEAEAQQQA